jgi:hypothetical protein
MKKYCLLLILLFAKITATKAQTSDTLSNEIKINLPALIARNISVQYERAISSKLSLALGLHLMPFGKLPGKKLVADLVDVADINFEEAKLGSWGIVPELRYYPGKKGVLKGFYFGPFFNYSEHKMDLPIFYNDKTGIFNGSVNTLTAGIQIGVQTKLSKKLWLDLWILGPNYGGSSGNLDFKGRLDEVEQSALRFNIQNIKDDFPVQFIESYDVNQNGAAITIEGPWAGLRGAGINLALKF